MLVLLWWSCSTQEHGHDFSYNFKEVASTLALPKSLNEISGLVYENDSILYAVQDEDGVIYEINTGSGSAKKHIKFKKKGDFEGITKVGSDFYVLRSDGILYKIDENGEYSDYNLFEKGYEFEGLFYSKERHSLLIACKQHKKKKKNDFVWIYEYDLTNNSLKETPFLKIEKEGIPKIFRPSGLAIHPNGNIFLISGGARMIIEVGKNKEIINKTLLPQTVFLQVEGICFNEKGDLYLASEKSYSNKARVYFLQQL